MNRAIATDSESTALGPAGLGPTGIGRPPVTSRAELEQISLTMFSAQGFEVTSVEEIAAAAGIGRRTFFRYFKSKNDAIWGDFDTQLDRFTQWFDQCPPEMPILAAIQAGVVEFNSFDASATRLLKDRMRIILSSPALQAYSTLRYGAWRAVIVAFAAARLGVPKTALVPRTLGHLALGAALAAYEQWLATDDTDLIPLLQQSLSILTAGSIPAGP
ncbi:mycofactocin system transcriptional regulator [Nakamurella sp. UYEF19]|uniref:mycofactocin system transcriptional regulator n=1 Tax=Nakamurella sp. UYEF19 TaxID=1756392 RepID=UPI0033920FCC